MRLRTATLAVAAALLLGGCGDGTATTASASPSPAVPWLRYAGGNAPVSPSPAAGARPSATGSSRTPLPPAPACDIAWPTDPRVLIPLIVTPGVRSLTVRWPTRYGPNYRVAAVDQKLITGTQPPPTWVNVSASAGCTTTATLTGLISGNPYVVWLDAPNTPRRLDNSRDLYSGRSGIVVPR
jgi:hypothetical protein